MKLEEYRSGEYIKMNDYKAFIPSKINYNWGWDDTKLDKLLAEANRQIGELNAYSLLIPNVDLYIKMHVKIEANKSSRIEGTRTTVEEDLLDVADINPEKRDDWEEVQNYVKATNYGVERIKEGFPVCTRLIREIHKILMQGVRGEHKTPGEFRTSQNWIGGSMPSTAVYVPPPHTEIAECLTDFEKFINNEEIDTPDLIKIAILHYQFESIHPFLDGNGRIGRLLIPLYIQSKGMIDLPVKPENAKKVLEVLYNEPIVSRKKIIENTGMKFTTLVGVINALQEKNILIETTGYSRNQVFAFQRYIDLFLK